VASGTKASPLHAALLIFVWPGVRLDTWAELMLEVHGRLLGHTTLLLGRLKHSCYLFCFAMVMLRKRSSPCARVCAQAYTSRHCARFSSA
jgi:hypothetical protein